MEDQRADHFYRTTMTDLLLIAVVLAFSVMSAVGTVRDHLSQGDVSKKIWIFQQDRLLKEIDLRQDAVFPVLDGRMRMEVKQGRVRVWDSDCPQHVCMHTGWIQYVGQTIVCVPNHVIIEIRSSAPPLLDAVAF